MNRPKELRFQQLKEIKPIPSRPEGYFTDCYTKEDTQLENKLGKFSVIEKTADLD